MPLCLLLPLLMSQSISVAMLGDPMPQGAIARFGSHRFYHGPGHSAEISPDGRVIATSARLPNYLHTSDKDRDHYDRTIILWNAATGERVRQFRAPQAVRALAFSSDGKQLAVAGSSSVSIIDLAGGLPARSIPGIDSPKELRFSADDKRLLVTEFLSSVKSIDLATCKLLKEWKRPTGPTEWLKENEYICDFEMSPDEKFIAWQIDQKPDTGKLKPGEYVPPISPARERSSSPTLNRTRFSTGSIWNRVSTIPSTFHGRGNYSSQEKKSPLLTTQSQGRRSSR